jgi:hypothetical protein
MQSLPQIITAYGTSLIRSLPSDSRVNTPEIIAREEPLRQSRILAVTLRKQVSYSSYQKT